MRAIAAAFGASGFSDGQAPEVAGAVMGLAGYYPPWHAEEARDSLRPILGERLRLEPDLKIAWAGATALRPGVVVVAGTGSVAYGEDSNGSSARAGGWGPLAGDEGSAPWIGAAALRAIGRALDGRGAETVLTAALTEAPDPVSDPLRVEQSLRAVYRDGWGRAEVAALAPEVAAAAEAGDRVAQEIMAQAAGTLAELALAVIVTLGRQGTPTPVSLTGGVAAAGAPLLDPFRRWLALAAPTAVVTAPRLSPLEGAALLALQHFGKRRE
jgi:N-acetylglucosamine kinase-like BadF-type ATPase